MVADMLPKQPQPPQSPQSPHPEQDPLPTEAANMKVGEALPIPLTQPITLELFWRIEAAVRAAGHDEAIAWTETIQPPKTSAQLAARAIYVIANSGMKNSVAAPISELVVRTLKRGHSARIVFGHPGKAPAMDWIWEHRAALFASFKRTPDVVEWCGSLPWVGEVTKYHLAKNLGADVAKPDVHLERLAKAERTTTRQLCARLSNGSGLRAATVDTILWRACADGIIDSKALPSKKVGKVGSKPRQIGNADEIQGR